MGGRAPSAQADPSCKVHRPSQVLYVYTENASKNQPGSLVQMRVKNKPILAVPESGTRCHVYVLDLYMKKLPAEAFSRDNFYVQPCPRVPDDPTKLGQFLCATLSKSS